MDFRYTSKQVARGSRPDARTDGEWYLFKNVMFLRLTYQVRLLTFAAGEEAVQLVIRVPRGCVESVDLSAFLEANRSVVRIERVAG